MFYDCKAVAGLKGMKVVKLNKSAAKDISILWISSIAGSASAFVIQLILAKILGPLRYGNFSSALTVVNIVTPLVGFGAAAMWLKVYGYHGNEIGCLWVRPSLRFTNVSSVLVFLLLCIIGMLMGDSYFLSLLLILFPIVLAQAYAGLNVSREQIRGRYKYVALWQICPNLLRLLVVAALYFSVYLFSFDVSPYLVAGLFSIVSLLIYVFLRLNFSYAYKRPGDIFYRNAQAVEKNITVLDSIRESWRFGVDGLVYLLYYQLSILIVFKIAGEHESGLYNLSFIFLSGAYVLPGVIFQKYLMPKLHRWAKNDREKIAKMISFGGRWMFFVGVAVALAVAGLGPLFIDYFIGMEYAQAANILYVLALCIPIKYMAASAGAALTSGNLLNVKLKIMMVGALICCLANFLLVPFYLGVGAAWATLITEISILAMMFKVAYDNFLRVKGER